MARARVMRIICVRMKRTRRGRVKCGCVLTVYSMVVGEGRRVWRVGGQVSIIDASIDRFWEDCEIVLWRNRI